MQKQSRKVLHDIAMSWGLSPEGYRLLFTRINENQLLESIKTITPKCARTLPRQEFLRARTVVLIYLLRQEPTLTETALRLLSDIYNKAIEERHLKLSLQLKLFFKNLSKSTNTIH